MSDRNLASIDQEIVENFLAFEQKMLEEHIEFVRACVYRSNAEQAMLFKQGRQMPGKIITWARPGESLHNLTKNDRPASRAVDYYPLVHGKLADRTNPIEHALWLRMGYLAKQCGIEWGGTWPPHKQDFPHFQIKESTK